MNVTFRKSFARDLKKINAPTVLDRVRIGDYRIGVTVQHDTVDFVRCLHRRNLYRFFP